MPRALWWFRWGAAVTWLTGVVLMMKLYYVGGPGGSGYLLADGSDPTGAGRWIAFGSLFVGFLVYDVVMKTVAPKSHAAAVLIWGAIAVGFAYLMTLPLMYDSVGPNDGFAARAIFIHVGALFGTSMAANVWMRIWPAQKRIITATKNGEAPDPADPALAGQRSKHNTYMSFALLLFMVSVDQTSMHGDGMENVWTVLGVLVIGWAACFGCYKLGSQIKGF